MTLTIGTHLLEPDNWDQLLELTIGTHLNWPILKQEKKNVIIKKNMELLSQKGHGPENKKAIMLG